MRNKVPLLMFGLAFLTAAVMLFSIWQFIIKPSREQDSLERRQCQNAFERIQKGMPLGEAMLILGQPILMQTGTFPKGALMNGTLVYRQEIYELRFSRTTVSIYVHDGRVVHKCCYDPSNGTEVVFP